MSRVIYQNEEIISLENFAKKIDPELNFSNMYKLALFKFVHGNSKDETESVESEIQEIKEKTAVLQTKLTTLEQKKLDIIKRKEDLIKEAEKQKEMEMEKTKENSIKRELDYLKLNFKNYDMFSEEIKIKCSEFIENISARKKFINFVDYLAEKGIKNKDGLFFSEIPIK